MSNKKPKSMPEVLEQMDNLVSSRGRRTDVDDVTLPVDHDVAIMTVLDLKNITRYGVCGH
jgi:hypothetical protein